MLIEDQPTRLKILSFGSNSRCLWADVAIEGTQPVITPLVAEQLLVRYPSLAEHACKSGGKSREDDAADAAMPADTAPKALAPPRTAPSINAAAKAGTALQTGLTSQAGAAPLAGTMSAGTFDDCIVGALLPHAAEHLVIELMVQAYPGEVFAGNTRWISRRQRHMRVRISRGHTATLAEIRSAFSEAIALLNELLAMCKGQTSEKTLS